MSIKNPHFEANRYEGQLQQAYFVGSKGEVLNIIENFVSCNLFEDIFSDSVSGNMLLKDEKNAIKAQELNGDDKLVIVLNYKDELTALEFLVYSHSYTRLTDNSELVNLNFISLPSVLSQNARVWGAYKGGIDSIVKQVYDGVVKDYTPTKINNYAPVAKMPQIECDTTEGIVKIVGTGKTPFETIAWLSGRATEVETSGSMFLFYQTIFEGYKFKCLEKLAKEGTQNALEESHVFYYGYAGTGYERQNLHEFKIHTLADTLKTSKELYTDLWLTDFTNKTILKRTFDANTSSQPLLNSRVLGFMDNKNGFNFDFESLRKSGNLRSMIKNESSQVHNGIDFKTGNSLQRKYSMLRQMNAMSVSFEAFSNHAVKVGDVVELFIPQKRGVNKNSDTSETLTDKEISGKYIVAAKRIEFEMEKVKMQVQCIKDSALE
jgi:hypothetical protein